MKVFGKNVIKELLNNPDKIRKIYLTNNFSDKEIMDKIRNNKVRYETMDIHIMNKYNKNTQGIMAEIDEYKYYQEEDIINENLIVILDHLEDPHNFGAIIRTCESAGIKTIIIPKDRGVQVNETVMKTSTGALSYVKIVRVNNLTNTINKLKKNNYFVYGAESDGIDYKQVNYADKVALVIGSEGNGLSGLVRKSCDEIISLPMKGQINSLNASVAAGILIYNLIK